MRQRAKLCGILQIQVDNSIYTLLVRISATYDASSVSNYGGVVSKLIPVEKRIVSRADDVTVDPLDLNFINAHQARELRELRVGKCEHLAVLCVQHYQML